MLSRCPAEPRVRPPGQIVPKVPCQLPGPDPHLVIFGSRSGPREGVAHSGDGPFDVVVGGAVVDH